MKVGDLVVNKNSESGEMGLFLGVRTYRRSKKYIERYPNAEDYAYVEVYWPDRQRVGTIQANLIKAIDETR